MHTLFDEASNVEDQVPLGHWRQKAAEVAAKMDEYDPGVQEKHKVEPGNDQVPALQFKHAEVEVAIGLVDHIPAAQLMQESEEVAATDEDHVPARHIEH